MSFEAMHPADQIVEMMNRIYRSGMTTTSGGNLSIRDENGDIWITPSGVDKGSLTREDIMQVKPDGSFVGKHRPSVEFPFHRDIYRARPDIGGVVHAHPPVLVGFSLLRRSPDMHLIPEAYHICGDVGQAPYNAPGTKELDMNISAQFALGYNAVLMANHGAVCGAENLHRAFMRFETLVQAAEIELNAHKLGQPRRLSEAQLAAAVETCELPVMEKAWRVSEAEQVQREELCAFARRCYDRRILSAAIGTISVRLNNETMLITPMNVDPLLLKPEDVVCVQNGRVETGKRAGEAVGLHRKIYELHSDVNAVILSHAPSIMAYAVTGTPFETRLISEGYIVLGDVQRVETSDAALDEAHIANVLGHRRSAAVVDNRCAIVTGASLLNAFDRMEVLEYGAASALAIMGTGKAVVLTDEEIEGTNRALNIS